jgi:hypothetical protein
MSIIRNSSSQSVWVVETDSHHAFAHILLSGRQSPGGVDADGVKGIDSSINGYSSWWKTPDLTGISTVYDDGRGSLTIACNACFQVPENQFGQVDFLHDPDWGEIVTRPCYFTRTLVDTMGLPDNGSEMNSLRMLRDHLSKSAYGNLLINEYEEASALFLDELYTYPEKDSIIKEVSIPITMEVVDSASKMDYQKAIDAWRKLRSKMESNLKMVD